MVRRVRILVHGRVQGVFFRDTARRTAHELGLTGFVRNRPDGAVELVAEGEQEGLDRLVEWAGRGSPASRVERVETAWEDANGEFAAFRIHS